MHYLITALREYLHLCDHNRRLELLTQIIGNYCVSCGDVFMPKFHMPLCKKCVDTYKHTLIKYSSLEEIKEIRDSE